MTTLTRSAPSAAPRPSIGLALLALLDELIQLHEGLLDLTREHAGALRRADGSAIDDCVRRRAGLTARIGELNDARSALLRAYPRGATLSQIAGSLGEAEAGEVLERGDRLRALMLEAKAQQSRIRAATDRLLAHMRGMAAQVHRALGDACTYSSAGRLAAGPRAVASFDLTS